MVTIVPPQPLDDETPTQEGEVRLDAIVRSAMDAIITVDSFQRIVQFNAAAEKMFACSSAEAIGSPLDRFIPARFRAAHEIHVARFVTTGETSRRMGSQTALSALRADGTEFPIEASISQAIVGGRTLLTVILRDVTERTRADEEIRQAHEELRGLTEPRHSTIVHTPPTAHDELLWLLADHLETLQSVEQTAGGVLDSAKEQVHTTLQAGQDAVRPRVF